MFLARTSLNRSKRASSSFSCRVLFKHVSMDAFPDEVAGTMASFAIEMVESALAGKPCSVDVSHFWSPLATARIKFAFASRDTILSFFL